MFFKNQLVSSIAELAAEQGHQSQHTTDDFVVAAYCFFDPFESKIPRI
jgi:hypothetical protein